MLSSATILFIFIPAILLKHLKLPVSAIREAVLSCDHSILGEQHIRLMAAFAPDKREVRGVTISFIYGFTRTPIVFSEKRILTLYMTLPLVFGTDSLL